MAYPLRVSCPCHCQHPFTGFSSVRARNRSIRAPVICPRQYYHLPELGKLNHLLPPQTCLTDPRCYHRFALSLSPLPASCHVPNPAYHLFPIFQTQRSWGWAMFATALFFGLSPVGMPTMAGWSPSYGWRVVPPTRQPTGASGAPSFGRSTKIPPNFVRSGALICVSVRNGKHSYRRRGAPCASSPVAVLVGKLAVRKGWESLVGEARYNALAERCASPPIRLSGKILVLVINLSGHATEISAFEKHR